MPWKYQRTGISVWLFVRTKLCSVLYWNIFGESTGSAWLDGVEVSIRRAIYREDERAVDAYMAYEALARFWLAYLLVRSFQHLSIEYMHVSLFPL
jgi:hypothetical protein